METLFHQRPCNTHTSYKMDNIDPDWKYSLIFSAHPIGGKWLFTGIVSPIDLGVFFSHSWSHSPCLFWICPSMKLHNWDWELNGFHSVLSGLVELKELQVQGKSQQTLLPPVFTLFYSSLKSDKIEHPGPVKGKQEKEDTEEHMWEEQRALLLGNQPWSTTEGWGFCIA